METGDETVPEVDFKSETVDDVSEPIEAAGREVDVNDPTDMFNGPFRDSDGVVKGSINKVIEDEGGGKPLLRSTLKTKVFIIYVP